ncbi:MAG: polysaccharide deacetylase family protein [bacterium]
MADLRFIIGGCRLSWLLAMTWATVGQAATATDPWSCRQELTLEFATMADAAQATVRIAALPDDKEWAFSARWDDNLPDNQRLHDAMIRHGLKGTFYLTGTDPHQRFGGAYARRLLAGGCTIGGHSQTHARLTGLAANAMFQEILSNRLERECQTDQPVVSFAFPFGAFDDPQNPAVREAITRALINAGFHHCVYLDLVRHNPSRPVGAISAGWQIKVGDADIDLETVQAQLDRLTEKKAAYQQLSKLFFLGGRATITGAQWDTLDELLTRLAGHDAWWYCNQNEFAAYERQRHDSRLWPAAANPTPSLTRTIILERPVPAELGAMVALTLIIDRPVKAARLDRGRLETRPGGDRTLVTVPFPGDQRLPERIDAIANPRNLPVPPVSAGSREFPGLLVWLQLVPAGDRLVLKLSNRTGGTLRDVRVTAMLPPSCRTAAIRTSFPDIPPAGTQETAFPIIQEKSGTFWRSGRAGYAAAIDFTAAGQPGRLYATTQLE